MVNSWRPMRSGVKAACQQSLSGNNIAVRRHPLSSAARQSSSTARTSCPSAKTSADTVMLSPTMRFDANRPASTAGVTLSITMRCWAEELAVWVSMRRILMGVVGRAPSKRTSPAPSAASRARSAAIVSCAVAAIPAAEGSGSSNIGSGCSRRRSVLIRITADEPAERTSMASERSSAVTGRPASARLRSSPSRPSDVNLSVSALASRISAATPAVQFSGGTRGSSSPLWRFMSTVAANSRPIGIMVPWLSAAARRK